MYREPAERPEPTSEPTPHFRGRRLGIVAVLLALTATAAAFVLTERSQRSSQRATLSDAVVAAASCVLPDGMPADADAIRRRQLDSLADPTWPRRCVPLLHGAAERALEAGHTDAELAALRASIRRLDQLSPGVNLAPALIEVHDALHAWVPRPRLPSAAVPEMILDRSGLGEVGRLFAGDGRVVVPRHFDGEPMAIAEGDGARAWCKLSLERVQCTNVPIPARSALHASTLAGTHDPGMRPLLFETTGSGLVHDGGLSDRDRVTRFDGAQVADGVLAQGGFVRADGHSWVIGPGYQRTGDTRVETVEWYVLEHSGARTTARRWPLEGLDVRVNGGQILWDRLFLRAHRDGDSPIGVLLSRPLTSAPGSASTVVFDRMQPTGMQIDGCRSERVTAVRYNGRLAFWDDAGRFGPSLEVPADGRLVCHGDAVGVASYSAEAGLVHARCTHDRCDRTALDASVLDQGSALLRPEPDQIQSTDVDGSLLVVWRAGTSGGLHLRVASPDAFSNTASRVIFDDHWDANTFVDDSTLLRFELFGLGGYAALVLHTTRGVHLLRVTANGAVDPWPLTRI